MSEFSDTFDSTNNYKGLGYTDGQFVVASHFNRMQDIQNWNHENGFIYSLGYQLKIDHNTNTPVLKVKANNDLPDSYVGQVITIQAVDATHVKWRRNSGSWSGSIAVTADGSTWNTVGTSGLEAVFVDTMAGSDESEVWVSQAMRLLGGELEHTGGTTYKLNEGRWDILGRYVELSDDSTTCNDGDYVYIKVTESEVTDSTDSSLGIFLGDGNYADKSPSAIQWSYDLQSSASFPNGTSDPWVKYILVGKVTSAAGGVFTQMWVNAVDVQQVLRLYGDTEAPSTPTGLTLSSGAEADLTTITTSHAISVPLNLGYLQMSCDVGSENDLDSWEFKVVRLDSGGNPTTDAQSYTVYNNTSAGGMSVPTGVSHTVHNLTMGVEYRVWVRAKDKSGNVSDWSASVDETVGGDCQIPVGDSGPSFTLTDTPGYVGFTLEVASLPTNADGYSVWVGEGSLPTPSSNQGLIGHFPANQASVKVPWPEGGHPYVVVQAYDASGQYHLDAGGSVVSTNDNVELAESAQLSTESHNSDPSSHGGLIGDYVTVTSHWGSLDRALMLLAAQGFDVENIYVVSLGGGYYSSVQAALNAIGEASDTNACIFVAPGEYDNGSSISFPENRMITIMGLGANSTTIAPTSWDLSNIMVGATWAGGLVSQGEVGVYFKDLSLEGYMEATNSVSEHGAVCFDSCDFTDSPGSNPLVYFNGGGEFWLYGFDSKFGVSPSSTQYVFEFENNCNVSMSNCTLRHYNDGTVVYFTSPSGERLFKNCAFEVNGASSGKTLDSDTGATDVVFFGNAYNAAMGANINLTTGATSLNTLMTGDYLID